MSKLLMTGTLLIGLLASCSDSGKSPIESGTPVKMTLKLSSPSVSKTAITVDPNAAAYITSESTINNVVVGLFDQNGALVGSIQPFTSSQITSSQITVSGTSAVTRAAVAVNVPSSSFSGVTTLSGFEGVKANLDNTATADASAAGTTQQYATALPMVGEVAITIPTSGTPTATVQLNRLVSKVILSGITPNFTGVYANASFTPTEVFMYNVPSTANCNSTSSTVAIASSPTYVQGEQGTSPFLTANPKSYMGSGTLSASYQTIPWSNQYISFYVFPNNSSTSQTELIIKGTFKMNSSDTGTTVYYPIILNSGTVDINKVYNLTAAIAAMGTTDPTKLKNVSIGVTMTVSSWTSSIGQAANF